MSETELRVGRAIPLTLPVGFADMTEAERIEYFRGKGFEFPYPDELYSPTLEEVNGRWFRIEAERHRPAYEIVRAVPRDDGSYDFTCMWYNGGASFNEVLVEAIERADATKGGSE